MNKPFNEDQDVRDLVSRLPRSVQPERDLWTGIRERIEAAPVRSAPTQKSISMRWAIAASVASLGLGVMLTWSMRPHATAPAAANPATVAAVQPPAEYSFVPASTDAMRKQLREATAAQLSNLPPKTREKVERDLALIDASVRDIQNALSKDPSNALLQDLLVTTYQNELNTLANVQVAAGVAHSEVST